MSFQEYPVFVKILAGTGYAGNMDGSRLVAQFNVPTRLALDSKNSTLYVTDAGNHCIRYVNTNDGSVNTLAGTCGLNGLKDGPLLQAKFHDPVGIALWKDELIVADRLNFMLRKIFLKNNTVSIFSGSGVRGYLDGDATMAQYFLPCGIGLDRRKGFEGSVLVSDGDSNRARLVYPNGTVTTLAGTGKQGYLNGPALEAEFNLVADVRSDSSGIIYISDCKNYKLRKLENGQVSRKAGNDRGYMDGPLSTALLRGIHGFAFDKNDGFIIADGENNLIRQILNDSMVTLAGTMSSTSTQEGAATRSSFNFPVDVSLDMDAGVAYIADSGNHYVKMICSAPCYNGGTFDCLTKKCTCVGKFIGPSCSNRNVSTKSSSTSITGSSIESSYGLITSQIGKEVILTVLSATLVVILSFASFFYMKNRQAKRRYLSSHPVKKPTTNGKVETFYQHRCNPYCRFKSIGCNNVAYLFR